MSQKTLSGIFKDPDSSPVSGVVLTFTLQSTTSDSFAQRFTSVTTDSSGAYSVSLYNGVYKVNFQDNTGKTVSLGNITITDSSTDGTLNDFLLIGNSTLTNALLIAIQQSYQQMLSLFNNPATTVASYADLPSSPSGWYLVTADETKSGTPSIYLFSGGNRYWFAMIEDA